MYKPVMHRETKGLRIREFDGYKITYYGRKKVMELYDENFDISKVPADWCSGVIFTKYGLTFTPACIKKLRIKGLGIESLKMIVKPENKVEIG